jgi:uncharacterized protein (TIGR02145 family)
MRKIYLFAAVIAVLLCAGCNDGGVESGERDAAAYLNVFKEHATGGSFDYVKVGGRKWMKKNLNVEIEHYTYCYGAPPDSCYTWDSWCYDDNPDNCETYGRLYTMEAASDACEQIGLSLPTADEWEALVLSAGGAEVAGKNLKAKNVWQENGNGKDKFGFSALPGGYRNSDGDFLGAGSKGGWWTKDEWYSENDGTSYGIGFYMVFNDDYVGSSDMWADSGGFDPRYGYSVRCVKRD